MLVDFDYQVQYEACALLFLVLLTWRFFVLRRFPSAQNAHFGLVLICAIADLVLDIASAYTIMFAAVLPVWVNYLINTVFYALQVLFPLLMTSYVLICAGQRYSDHPGLLLLLLPAAGCMGLLLTNPLTHSIFYLPLVNGLRHYARGPLFNVFYLGTAFYLLATVIMVFRHRALLAPLQRRIMITFIFILVAATLLQYLFPDYLLTGVAIVLAIQLMFFTLQAPEEMLDVISGAFNYNALLIYLNAAIEEKRPLWLVAVDVGGVRRLNSAFGLSVGNTGLRQIGDFLSGLGKNSWLFRMMGTRFILTAPNEEAFHDFLSAIDRRFARPWELGEHQLYLSATVRHFGNACDFASSDEVITLIDAAFSGAGWGKSSRIGPELLSSARRQGALEDAMRDALRSGRGFSLCYQPIYDVATGRFNCAEALLRLTSPALGPVSPAEFIPVAEKSGLILRIDELVVDMASRALARIPALDCLEINLSAAEFFRNPAEKITAIVERAGADPRRICFEITETAAFSGEGTVGDFMADLIPLGYRFALDDFGTGYANLSRIAELPFSMAKLDKLLLSDDDKGRILLDAVVAMFRRLGIETVSEGVEDRETDRRVRSAGAEHIQGYYYAKPMPEEDLLAFLAAHRPEFEPDEGL